VDRFFSIFGKIALTVIFLSAIAAGGYYFGKSGKISLGTNSEKPGAATTTNPTPEPTLTTEEPVAASPTSTMATPKTKTVSAGLDAESGLSFTKYTAETPDGWAANHQFDVSVPTDTLTLTKGAYQIKIYQAASGGSQCVYAGEPTPDHPFVSPYDAHADISSSVGVFRRSSNGGPVAGKMTYTICQKSEAGTYGSPTSFGHISVTAPAAIDAVIMKEVDGIIASLKKS
jgi:hypothetical protein